MKNLNKCLLVSFVLGVIYSIYVIAYVCYCTNDLIICRICKAKKRYCLKIKKSYVNTLYQMKKYVIPNIKQD